MKILTDGHTRFKGDKVKISTADTYKTAPDIARSIIAEMACADGTAAVCFSPITAKAIGAVEAEFGDVYTENNEGYIIIIDESIEIFADTPRAMLYAANSISGHYDDGIEKGILYNYPLCEHRSARVFLPPKSEIPYFKRFIDMLVYFGYNSLLLEVGGSMEYKKHPEINEGWQKYCKSMNEYNGKVYHQQISTRIKNSVHTCNAGGDIYSQEELRELISYCEERFIEIIPEIPSLSHSDYILINHPELAECADEYVPDTCCPQNPALYDLVFDLYDEALEVFQPKTLHIGHDEWWVMCICDKCKGNDPARLFADNVNKCYEYLKSKGVETMMWADKLVPVCSKTGEVHGAAYKKIWSVDDGSLSVDIMGRKCPVYTKYWFNAPENIKELGGIPHEILDTRLSINMINPKVKMTNWYWSIIEETNDAFLQKGLWTVYGNCKPTEMTGWFERVQAGARGLSVSCWCSTDEIHLQKYSTLFNIGYGTNLLWNRQYDENNFLKNILATAHDMFSFRNKETLKSAHVEITHAASIVSEPFVYPVPASCVDMEGITMGEYIIHYKNGADERIPVLFGSNIGLKSACLEWTDSTKNYKKDIDPHLVQPACVCDYIEAEDGMWYKFVVKTAGEVEKVEFVPRDEYKNNVLIKEIQICV